MSEFTRHTLPKCLTTELETTADIDPVLDRIVLQIPILKQIGNIEMSKQRLELPFKALNGEFTQLQKSIYNHMVKYRDIYYVNENLTNDDNQPSIDTQLRRLYAFHALDHIYKTRDMILKNNERLKIIDDKSKEKSGNKAKENFSNNVMTNSFVDEQIRDQGFTRAKVLIVTPFKNDAYLFINDLISISGTTETTNLKRFIDEFGPSESDHISNPHKPKDFNQTFEGNIDDCYKIGLKFQRKNVKLYSNFQTSDILIVSPLGLKLIIGEEGDKKRDFDYLSSIEILMVWHPHIYLMQNWEHFKSIYDHLNLIPIHQQSCDFSRVKTHVLEGNAKMTRQTLVCSDSQFAELSSFINTCSNHSGSVRISSKIPGQILNVTSKTPQVFIRINTPLTVSELPDARFDNFIKIILPKLIHKPKTLLFIPSYYDFVRVRLHLKNHNYSFVAVSEYSPKAHVDQSRHFFNNGKVPLMVFTERLHFFRRYNFSCEDLIFYSPAVFAKGYEQLVAFSDSTCMVYWSVYDRFAMERIVGSDRCEKMVKAERDQYMFTL